MSHPTNDSDDVAGGGRTGATPFIRRRSHSIGGSAAVLAEARRQRSGVGGGDDDNNKNKGGGGDGCWRFNLQISTWILLIQIQNSNLSRAEFKSRKIQDLSRDSKALARDLLESSREQPLTLKIIIFLHQQR